MLESEDEIDIDKNDSKTMSAIAKELLKRYRKSLQQDIRKQKIWTCNWGLDYMWLLQHHNEKDAETMILEKIQRETGVDIIHAKIILKKSIEEERKKN